MSPQTLLPFRHLDLIFEVKKMAVLRICLGLIILHRYSGILVAADLFSIDENLTVLIYTALLLSGFFAIGFLTPITILSANILVIYVDKQLGIHNLGTAAFSNVVFLLFFAQSGRLFSLDQYILKRSVYLRKLYPDSWCTPGFMNSNYFIGFLIFGLVNLASVAGHLMDPFWLSGTVLHITFQNPFYSTYFEKVALIAENYPLLYGFICTVAEIFQIIWQVLMIPLIFLKYGRLFVLLWGAVFFVMSFFFLQLSYLSYYLFVLWGALFFTHTTLNDLGFARRLAGVPLRIRLDFLPVFVAVPFIVMFFSASFLVAWHLASAFRNGSETFRYDIIKTQLPKTTMHLFDGANVIGLITPNVFNTPDVLAARNFVFIERSQDTGVRWELVPFIGYAGDRLAYHNNDLLYYGYSIPLRRCIQTSNIEDCLPYLNGLKQYDLSILGKGDVIYRYGLSRDGDVLFGGL